MIVLLTFYAERSARQVSEEMTITEGHVRVIRHRAIGKLRACMTATGAGAMTPRCDAPVSDDELLDYWTHAIAGTDAERIEEHLFSCGDCSARLEAMASLGAGLAVARAPRTGVGYRLALAAQPHATRWRARAPVYVVAWRTGALCGVSRRRSARRILARRFCGIGNGDTLSNRSGRCGDLATCPTCRCPVRTARSSGRHLATACGGCHRPDSGYTTSRTRQVRRCSPKTSSINSAPGSLTPRCRRMA